MGFDYEICYRRGKDNVVADALSRLPTSDLTLMAISIVSSSLFQEIQQHWLLDTQVQQLIQSLQAEDHPPS